MMLDRYNVNDCEIFQKSQCRDQERNIASQIEIMLQNRGYAVDSSGQVWQRDNRKVVVSFVDDFSRLSAAKKINASHKKENWFDSNTLVITDNHICFDPEFEFQQAPDSYFGIYSYTPEKQTWEPEKDFHFSVNRLDDNRLAMCLELFRFYGVDSLLERAYMNFNAYNPYAFNYSENDAKNNFQWCYQNFQSQLMNEQYDSQLVSEVKAVIPVKNHSFHVNQADYKTWVNVVMETYVGKHVISLSEKVFRALVTPVPWICICGRGSIEALATMGFDTMSDVVDHSYNQSVQLYSNKSRFAKFRDLVGQVDNTVAWLKQQPFKKLQSRAKKAADHNIKLLAAMKKDLYKDLDPWLQQVSKIC